MFAAVMIDNVSTAIDSSNVLMAGLVWSSEGNLTQPVDILVGFFRVPLALPVRNLVPRAILRKHWQSQWHSF